METKEEKGLLIIEGKGIINENTFNQKNIPIDKITIEGLKDSIDFVHSNLPDINLPDIDTDIHPEMVYYPHIRKIINRNDPIYENTFWGRYSLDFRRNSKAFTKRDKMWMLFSLLDVPNAVKVFDYLINDITNSIDYYFPKNKFPNREIRLIHHEAKIEEVYPYKNGKNLSNDKQNFVIWSQGGITQLVPKSDAHKLKYNIKKLEKSVLIKKIKI